MLKLGRLRRQRVEQLMDQRKAQGLWLSNFFSHTRHLVSNPAKAVGITNGEPEKEDPWIICRTPTCLLISYWLRFVFQSWTCLQWCGILILKTWDLYLGSLWADVGSLLQHTAWSLPILYWGLTEGSLPAFFDPFSFPQRQIHILRPSIPKPKKNAVAGLFSTMRQIMSCCWNDLKACSNQCHDSNLVPIAAPCTITARSETAGFREVSNRCTELGEHVRSLRV